jgi:hypothetical protein
VLTITDTGYELEVQYRQLSMVMDMPTGYMEFSSDNANGDDIMSAMLNGMMNTPFGVTMTRQGKVTEVRGIHKLFNTAFEKYSLTEQQKQEIMNSLSQTFGNESFKANLEMFTYVFPSGPVSVGDKWTTETTTVSTMAATVKSTYTLDAIDDGQYVISGKSEIHTTADAGDSAPMKYDMSGTMTSRIKVARNTGWIKDASFKQSMLGKIIFPDNPKCRVGWTYPWRWGWRWL